MLMLYVVHVFMVFFDEDVRTCVCDEGSNPVDAEFLCRFYVIDTMYVC